MLAVLSKTVKLCEAFFEKTPQGKLIDACTRQDSNEVRSLIASRVSLTQGYTELRYHMHPVAAWVLHTDESDPEAVGTLRHILKHLNKDVFDNADRQTVRYPGFSRLDPSLKQLICKHPFVAADEKHLNINSSRRLVVPASVVAVALRKYRYARMIIQHDLEDEKGHCKPYPNYGTVMYETGSCVANLLSVLCFTEEWGQPEENFLLFLRKIKLTYHTKSISQYSPLVTAVRMGNLPLVRDLLRHDDASLGEKFTTISKYHCGMKRLPKGVLELAIGLHWYKIPLEQQRFHPGIVKLLLSAGAQRAIRQSRIQGLVWRFDDLRKTVNIWQEPRRAELLHILAESFAKLRDAPRPIICTIAEYFEDVPKLMRDISTELGTWKEWANACRACA